MDATIIWSLRKPLLWVWRKLAGLMGAWTVEPIFRQSHDYHIALRRWQQRWVELADGVEYKLLTRSSFDGDETAEQSVWIRNSGETVIDEVQFCVDAKLGRVSYQVPLAVYRLQPGCLARLTLNGLPLQDLMVDQNAILTTYESVQVYPVRIVRNRQLEIYEDAGIAWHPTHDDFLNGEWQRWNGRLYNTKAIAESRRENRLRLAHFLCWRYGLLGFDAGTLLGQALRTRCYRSLPGVLMFGLVTSNPVINLVVWTRLLLRIERIAFECDPAMAAATEHVLHKGGSARPRRVLPFDALAVR
jgi:hypothetical protein